MIIRGLADKAIERVAGTMSKTAEPSNYRTPWPVDDLENLPSPAPGKRDFSEIKVLWRKPETMELFGIPYALKPQQSPKDLAPRLETSWIRLGYEGKWVSPEAENFVQSLGNAVPENPNEYTDLATWGAEQEEQAI